MKKLFSLLSFSFALFTFSFAQQYGWQDISANIPQSGDQPPDLSDVYFISDDEGWITSSSHAEIYHTTDGGETFEIQTTPYSCNAIYMINEVEGYAGGEYGRIYITTNSGENWVAIGNIGVTLMDISHPPSGDTGYACGDKGHVHLFTSSGETNLNSGLSPLAIRGISAPSDNNVWVCGGNRIYYYNETNFTSQNAPTGTFNDIHFINNHEGWVVGNGGVIGHTIDGAGWGTQTNPDTLNRSLYAVFFLDSDNGLSVGIGGVILKTTDAGNNWAVVGAGITTEGLSSIHFTSPTNGYIVGNNKTLLKYTQVSGVSEHTTPLPYVAFPNPASHKITIQSAVFRQQSTVIEIYDLNGRKLIEKHTAAGSETVQIDVSSLKSGVFCVQILSGVKTATKKLIIE